MSVGKQDTWKKGREAERALTGKLVPCPGEAHDPAVGGMIDNCGICAPRWGEVEERAPLDLADAFKRGLDIPFGLLTDRQRTTVHDWLREGIVDEVSITRHHKGGGSSTYFVVRRTEAAAAVLAEVQS